MLPYVDKPYISMAKNVTGIFRKNTVELGHFGGAPAKKSRLSCNYESLVLRSG